MLSGIEDAPWQSLSLCVLMHEMPSVSRMREIRTSGLMRGEGLKKKQSLLYSTVRLVSLLTDRSHAIVELCKCSGLPGGTRMMVLN